MAIANQQTAKADHLRRGSQWNKWDLHIHSPLSALNNQFAKLADGTPNWSAYIQALVQLTDTPAIGVTDYFTIDGYKEILAAKKSGKLPSISLLLPNIEFRIDKLINTKSVFRRLNYHVIFSDQVSPQDIEEHFLQEIKFQYEGDPQRADLSLSVRRQNLELLGRRLKQEHPTFNDGRSDFEIGCMNATVDPAEIKAILQNKAQLFEGKYLILLPEEHMSLMDWDGQHHQTRKVLLQGADAILSKNPHTIQWALGGGTASGRANFVKEFKTLKPCVGGSDAHSLSTIGKPDLDRFCWIKSDLTFEGLKQILYEPKDRVYFGDAPPNLKNDYQVIDRVTISNSAGWFEDATIPLSSDLVSVIGPRGSGKSALAELIALAGGSNIFRGGSDLKETFLAKASKRSSSNPKTLLGTKVQLFWKDKHQSPASIDTTLRTPQPEEEVKYLPQKFVEWLCAPENNHELEHEIERVIYQRHQKSAQTDASNFQELRRSATQALQTRRSRLAHTIKALNETIGSRTEQIEELAQKEKDVSRRRAELETVAKSAPSIPEANRADIEELAAFQKQRLSIVDRISQLNRQLDVLNTVAAKYEILATDISQFNREISELLATAGVTEVQPCLVPGPPGRATEITAERRTAVRSTVVELQGTPDDASEQTLSGIDKKITRAKGRLSLTENKQKEYEKNQADRKKLESAIAALERDIKEINDVIKPKIQAEQQERIEAFLDAMDLLNQEIQVLAQLYQPLREALADANDTANRLGFISKVVFDSEGHASRGMELFDRRRSTVRDEEALRGQLNKYFEDVAGNDFERIYTQKAFEQLRSDILGKIPLREQLREKRSPREFADWLFDIEPYSVSYTLEYDKKDLKYLSPGEKGIVLLLLYLEAEEDDHRPLIIDQPDDNLDNLSIYPGLIEYFRERKQTRQIVIITHNPNLVVTTDSEQIIIGSFDGSRTPRIQYLSGALEGESATPSSGIRTEVCRVLEGGADAFRIREHRYDIPS
jgi:AAA domain